MAVKRRFATPVPRAADLDDLNRSLRERCDAERGRVVRSVTGPFTIRDRLAEDHSAAALLPAHRFDPRAIRPAVDVDKYQTVAFDGSRYRVPPQFAFEMVTVKGYVDRVVIAARGQVAEHPRRVGEPMVQEPRDRAVDARAGVATARIKDVGSQVEKDPTNFWTQVDHFWTLTSIRRGAPARGAFATGPMAASLGSEDSTRATWASQ